MLIKSEKIQKEGEENYYVEAIFDSSNVLKTLYFPHKKRLFISFKRGGTYSYSGISQELYDRFEAANSQGMFHAVYIKDNNKYPFRKEFTLYPSEINDIDKVIEEKKIESDKLLKESIIEEDDDIKESVLRIYHQTYGYTFDNLVHTDPKFLSLLKAFKEGYVLGNEEKTIVIDDDEPLNQNYPPNNDELYATIEILHQALRFYANKANYIGKDTLFTPIQIDNGFQAEYAIKMVNKLEEDRYKEMEKISETYGSVNLNVSTHLNNIRKEFKGLLENE
jgi:hypothetical protein